MYNLSLVVITGMSGAGKSTVAKAVEDLGYYTIDNMPLLIIEKFVEIFTDVGVAESKIALVIDARSGGGQAAYKVVSMLQQKYGAKVIFLIAATNTLVNRFKESRRKHPLGGDILEAIAKEEEILRDIKSLADLVIDTSGMNVHELTSTLSSFFQKQGGSDLLVTVNSFGFKFGVPVDSDLLLDVRFLRNPHFVEDLKELTGKEKAVSDYVLEDPTAAEFIAKLYDMLVFLIPRYQNEGKRFLKISIGCTGGRHRSVAISELLTKAIANNKDLKGLSIQVQHRDIKR